MEESLETPETTGADRTWAIVAYLGPLVVVPLLMRSKGRFVAFHTRQAMYLFVLAIVAVAILLAALAPMRNEESLAAVFQVLSVVTMVVVVGYAATVLVMVVGVARGRMPMLPVLGELAGES